MFVFDQIWNLFGHCFSKHYFSLLHLRCPEFTYWSVNWSSTLRSAFSATFYFLFLTLSNFNSSVFRFAVFLFACSRLPLSFVYFQILVIVVFSSRISLSFFGRGGLGRGCAEFSLSALIHTYFILYSYLYSVFLTFHIFLKNSVFRAF